MFLRSACALGLVVMIGCSTSEQGDVASTSGAESSSIAQAFPAAEPQASVGPGTDPLPPAVPDGRKIIFEAHLSVDVVEFGEAAREVDREVVAHSGFITSSWRGGQSGATRSGTWTLRVPVDRYRALVDAVTQLGELRDHRETSQEVTDEFYDLEARIQNKQQEEQRLLAHLDETARNLQEILTIEQELNRVRGEVERMQGRLRLLADKTSLSTIHLSLQEIETFVPAAAPTFATRIDRAWRGSLESLMSVSQSAAIGLTGAAPWAVTLIVIGFLPAQWLRRRLATR